MAFYLLVLGKRIILTLAMLLRHPILIYKTVKKSNVQPDVKKQKYSLSYVIPKYDKNMNFCDSTDKNLRSVYLCELNAPKIIAMANKLGAFKVSNKEYAENCFSFVKNKVCCICLQRV